MDDNIHNLRDALEWLDRRIREEAEYDGEMSNEHAIELAFIQSMLAKFPLRNCDEERAVEHATRHAEAVARDNCRDCVHNPSGKNYEGGNAAAMRDALVSVRALIADEPDGTPMIDAMKATIEAALSAPPRNCDRFQVAAEALQEWQSLVKAKPNTWDFRYNYWLFAPAVEREGEDDGSK